MDPLYKQLITASPSTLLDIKKLQKRSANLLKNRAWFKKHYSHRWGPNFLYSRKPGKRREPRPASAPTVERRAILGLDAP